MKKTGCNLLAAMVVLVSVWALAGCGEREKSLTELAAGNWTQLRNRAYILLVTSQTGAWSSSVRIPDVTSKIVKSKGSAKGTWHIENNQAIFTVTESDIEEIWVQNATLFFDIVELNEEVMKLREESGRVAVWKKNNAQKTTAAESPSGQIIPVGPVTVNLNKNRSNDKDRYLCLDLNLELKELMPDQVVPPIHPKAREAVILFLSSLVFNDVKDFDSLKQQAKALVDVLNPYMQGFIQNVVIEHVIVASDIDKVEEFIIEHTMSPEAATQEEGGDGAEKSEGKE